MEQQLSFTIADAVELGDLGAYIAPPHYEHARERLKNCLEHYDGVKLRPDQWEYLCGLEAQCRANLPEPFTCEALNDFFLEIVGTDYLVIFQQSDYPAIVFEDQRKFVPKVDCTIGKDKHGEYHLGGMGLLYAQPNQKPHVAYYWVGEVKKHFIADSIIDIMNDYFVVQYAFHVVPDRIVEVEREPSALSNEPKAPTPTTPKEAKKAEHRRRLATIQRTVYISDTPIRKPGRKFIYQCNCWYVNGFWRQLKDGEHVWVKGYFKGRDRLNESARKAIIPTDYVLQKE